MIYDCAKIEEAKRIALCINDAKKRNIKVCYFNIEFDSTIANLKELGYFVAFAPERQTYSISW